MLDAFGHLLCFKLVSYSNRSVMVNVLRMFTEARHRPIMPAYALLEYISIFIGGGAKPLLKYNMTHSPTVATPTV